ncbi:MAG: prenyltransferase/squalene oxidase repeat-containing protein, partial [Planctomycetota bacterium]
ATLGRCFNKYGIQASAALAITEEVVAIVGADLRGVLLALAEVYGVTREKAIRDRLQDAVEFTAKCQNETGGWRYAPFSKDSDMSVTVCQVVALRAARNAGIKVPRATIDRALSYVIMSANTVETLKWPKGSFLYQPQTQQFNRDSFALCAAGLTTIFQAGLYDDASIARYIEAARIPKRPPPRLEDFIDYMRETYTTISRGYARHYFFYYGNYYAAQALYQYGVRHPGVWASWYRRVRDDLLHNQVWGPAAPGGKREGWWQSNIDTTNAYGTASALLILQFPLDQLPIHQR